MKSFTSLNFEPIWIKDIIKRLTPSEQTLKISDWKMWTRVTLYLDQYENEAELLVLSFYTQSLKTNEICKILC